MAEPIIVYKPSSSIRTAYSLCIYGKSGIGKTTLVGTFPGRGLVVDVPQTEGGTFVLEDKADRIDVTEVRDWNKDIDKVFWHLRDNQHPYQWVAIDSITGFQRLARTKIIAERDFAADPHKITLPEYGAISSLVADLIYRFKTLNIHTIWIAQERKFGNAEKGEHIMLGPDIIPSALGALMPPMLLVGHLTTEKSPDDGQMERRLRIQPHPDEYAKVRARPSLSPQAVVRQPDLSTIMRYLFAGGPEPMWADENTSGIIFL